MKFYSLKQAINKTYRNKSQAKQCLDNVKNKEFNHHSNKVMQDFISSIIKDDMKIIQKQISDYKRQRKINQKQHRFQKQP